MSNKANMDPSIAAITETTRNFWIGLSRCFISIYNPEFYRTESVENDIRKEQSLAMMIEKKKTVIKKAISKANVAKPLQITKWFFVTTITRNNDTFPMEYTSNQKIYLLIIAILHDTIVYCKKKIFRKWKQSPMAQCSMNRKKYEIKYLNKLQLTYLVQYLWWKSRYQNRSTKWKRNHLKVYLELIQFMETTLLTSSTG